MFQGRPRRSHWPRSLRRREALRDRRQGARRRAGEGPGLLQPDSRNPGGDPVIRLTLAVLLFGASPVTDLVPTQVKNVKLRVPAVWNHTDDSGTQVYTSPAKDAQLLVDVGAVQTAGMTA